MTCLAVVLALLLATVVVAGEQAPTFSSPFIISGGSVFVSYDPSTSSGRASNQGGYFEAADVVIGGGQILQLLPSGAGLRGPWSQLGLTVVNASGKYVVPGWIDPHEHVSGGGGEAGPASRTPQAQLSQIVSAGVTTVVGVLGTDSVTRSLDVLLATLNGLDSDGLSTYMWTGAYRVPPPTFFGTVIKDVQLMAKVLGVGEIAISDHRSSWPSKQELLSLISDARVGGMLAGKCGLAHFHVGSYPTGIEMLLDIANTTAIPITQMYPTHVSSRGAPLLQQTRTWLKLGGFVDMTADNPGDPPETVDVLDAFYHDGLPLHAISISSDAYGSLPTFSDGVLVGYGVALPSDLHYTVKTLVDKKKWPLQRALPLVTSNPARFLKLTNKGHVAAGYDADVLVMDPASLAVDYVFARGQVMKTPLWVKRGMFECLYTRGEPLSAKDILA